MTQLARKSAKMTHAGRRCGVAHICPLYMWYEALGFQIRHCRRRRTVILEGRRRAGRSCRGREGLVRGEWLYDLEIVRALLTYRP
jgi:hypothetical protein